MIADLGTVLNQAHTALKSSYTAGSLFQSGQAQQLSLFVDAAFDAATTLGDVKVKLQGRYNRDGITGGWCDLPLTKSDGTVATEITVTASAGATVSVALHTGAALATDDLQVLAHYDTGTPAAGDSITVYALAAVEDE